MTKQEEISRLLGLLQELTINEIKTLRKQLSAKTRKIRISKYELQKFVKQNKSTRAISQYYKISQSTITRRIKEYGLTGLRPRGRKPKAIAPRKPRIKTKWISMRRYIQQINRNFRFINIKSPPKKWINPETLVSSNHKRNPKGDFTTVGIYFIIKQSNVHLLYTLSIRYSEEPVPFEEIYSWSSSNVFDIVLEHAPRTAYVVDVVALTFEKTIEKPKKIVV